MNSPNDPRTVELPSAAEAAKDPRAASALARLLLARLSINAEPQARALVSLKDDPDAA